MIKKLKHVKGEGYIDIVVVCIMTMLVLNFILAVFPIFITKISLNNYANELMREAEISGCVGVETTARLERLNELKELFPSVSWSRTGNIQLGTEFTVTVRKEVDFSFFVFQNFRVTVTSTATGVSEVYRK